MDTMQTEFPFTLPIGYVDEDGTLHRQGTMRLATAADEIIPLKDPRVQENPAYLTIIVLSRVVTKLGTLPSITPHIIENMFAMDLAQLQALYNRINQDQLPPVSVQCPNCDHTFDVEVPPPGESSALPPRSKV